MLQPTPVSRVERWFSEEPRRPPAEIACSLARGRFWRDERQRLIGSHRDWDEGADYLLGIPPELGHALVLTLSQLPTARRRPFADAFYERQRSTPGPSPEDEATRLAIAANIILKIAEVVGDQTIFDERTLDLLRGTEQGDDMNRTPPAVLASLREKIARIRLEFELEDPPEPRGAAALALAEVLDPSSGTVDLKEVLARSTWAAVETVEEERVLRFLLDVDSILADA
jgi:hypothetical protein